MGTTSDRLGDWTHTAMPRRRAIGLGRAFTLIELLVVISIIALLIALLLPSLEAARTVAQKTASLSNARQVSIALHTYATDNTSMPYSNFAAKYDSGQGKWRPRNWGGRYWGEVLVNSDYADPGVFWSPERQKPWELIDADGPSGWYGYHATGYGLNQGVGPRKDKFLNSDRQTRPLRPGEASAPPTSEMLMIAEAWSTRTWGEPAIWENGIAGIGPDENGEFGLGMFNYDGGVVRSYVDGHAHAQREKDTVLVGRSGLLGPDRDATGPDKLGWGMGVTPEVNTRGGHYRGNWRYGSRYFYIWHAPWFTNWHSDEGWHDGVHDGWLHL